MCFKNCVFLYCCLFFKKIKNFKRNFQSFSFVPSTRFQFLLYGSSNLCEYIVTTPLPLLFLNLLYKVISGSNRNRFICSVQNGSLLLPVLNNMHVLYSISDIYRKYVFISVIRFWALSNFNKVCDTYEILYIVHLQI